MQNAFAALTGGGIESFQSFLFQPCEKGGAGHIVRKLGKIHGGGFDGERKAAEQPHEQGKFMKLVLGLGE